MWINDMQIFKKTINLFISIFNPKKYDNRIDNLVKNTESLQKKANDSLRRAIMDGEEKWFLRSSLGQGKDNHII
jgi:hypothetical protein